MNRPALSGDDLYFAKVPSGSVKIGRSNATDKRLRGLQTGCPERFEWTKVLKGRGHEEKLWHAAFDSDRLHGEWFVYSAEMDRALKAESCEGFLPGLNADDVDGQKERDALRRLVYGFYRNKAHIQAPGHEKELAALMGLAGRLLLNERSELVASLAAA